MSSFTEPPALEQIGPQLWRVLKPFDYHIGWIGSGFVIHIPALWESDLASIPRPLQRWLKPDGPWANAALIHDYLYGQGLGTKLLADVVFYEALGCLHVRQALRLAMFWAVCLFGRGAYFGQGACR